MACGTVESHVNYLRRLPLYETEKPFQLFVPIDPSATDKRATNLDFESQPCTFSDIRNDLHALSLDRNGVQIRKHPTKLDNSAFQDRDLVETAYFDEVKEILTNIEGGYDRIFIFDWRLRNSATPLSSSEIDMNDYTKWLRPSPTAHVDQSDRAVLHRIQLHFPDDALNLLQGRVRVVNVWRPLEHVIEENPLAFCAPTSVSERDLVECDHVRRKFKGSTLYSYYNKAHQWSYLGNHHPDEVLLLKMFDSDPTVPAKRVLHASFRHPSATEKSLPRKSIEVRALVFNNP